MLAKFAQINSPWLDMARLGHALLFFPKYGLMSAVPC